MIPEAAIRRYAGENRVDIAVARQEVVLTILLERIFTGDHLRDSVAAKGGTALRKLVFGSAGRFSEDMDFVVLIDDYHGVQADLMALLTDTDAAQLDGVRVLDFDFEQSEEGTVQARCQFESERGAGRFELDITGGADRRPLLDTFTQAPVNQSYFGQLGFSPSPIRRLETAEMIAEKLASIHRRYENGNPKDVWDLWKWLQLRDSASEIGAVRLLWPVRLWLDRQHWRGRGWFDQMLASGFDWTRLRPLLPHSSQLSAKAILEDLSRRLGPWIDEDEDGLLADAGTGRRRTPAMARLEAARRAVPRR